ALRGVPPDVALALAPRRTVGGGRRAVVHDAAVRRPRPPPLRGDPALLGARLAARRQVLAAAGAPGVDPAAARGRAVVGELLVRRDRRARRDDAAVDLAQHR